MLYINLLIILAISFTITSLLIKFQDKINLYANINHRTIHEKITPNSGGIAMFLSFVFGIFFLNIDIEWGILISIIFIFFIGIYDDKYGASSKQKIFFLFIVGNILFFNNYYIEYLGTFLGNEIHIDGFMAYLFIVFAVIGFVNAVNLIDGIDGLASVVGIIILSSYLYLGIKFNDQFLIYISSVYMMSIMGYLYFNWSPAKIFMGDSGSLTLGLIIVIVAVHSVNMHYITPMTVLMLSALPILDTFIVISRRIFSGKNPFVADKLHIHHLVLKQQENNTKRTVLILGLVQFILSYIGLGFKIKDDILILILFVMLFLLFYFLLTVSKKEELYDNR